jgi:Phospholipase_D-nuclease N-terminal
MGRLFPLLFLAGVALAVVALIDCLSTESDEVRALPRFAWIFVILLFPVVGPIVWFSAGRPPRAGAGPRAWGVGSYPERSRPRRQVGPDDDPEFLRNLTTTSPDDEEILRRFEEDLRRRDDDPRTKKPDDPTD